MAIADTDASVPDELLGAEARQARQTARQAVARATAMLGADAHRLRASCGSARGMRADLGLRQPSGASDEVIYEVKTMAFGKANYRVRACVEIQSRAERRSDEAAGQRPKRRLTPR